MVPESEDRLMRSIGEKVVYGSYGVMEIVDIREEKVMDLLRKYYVLEPVGRGSDSQTFIPVDNESLVSQMHPLLTKNEIIEILGAAGNMPPLKWIADNRQRSEQFKAIIESGDRAAMLTMIGSIHKTGERRNEEGKKNYLADENAMHKAEKILNTEFSIVLGIPEEDVPKFIRSEMEKNT